jgi:aminoglycoside 3-N-acetyltransferase
MEALAASFLAAGVRPGGVLLVHSSLSSLGDVPGGADTVLDALLLALGPNGTLVVPTLSYLFCTEENPVFDVRSTPTSLGAIPSCALKRAGALRSLHPTHSCCAIGALAAEVVARHAADTSPVGPGSPFAAVRALKGQVGFLGCGTRTNTSIHGVEELVSPPPPYLMSPEPVRYQVTDADGVTHEVVHRRHNFHGVGQRYERLAALMPERAFVSGEVGTKGKLLELYDAEAMWDTALKALSKDPWAFCDEIEPGTEDHFVQLRGGGTYYGYWVGRKEGGEKSSASKDHPVVLEASE